MLKAFLIFWIFKNSAYASEELCIFKHQTEISSENFNILKRNITDIESNGIGIIPNEISFKNNGQTVIVKYHFEK
ncbi:hypothetical protein DOY81_006994 [Sarcophaga bullata]|nr:hypothetical protein DOY81_006994 [Sarcophaga bullata]